MQFNVKCVREFLEENGKVYTVRGYLMKDKKVFVEGVGNCKRELIREIHFDNELRGYLTESGFFHMDIAYSKRDIESSLKKWWDVIERFCKNKPKFLYLVVKEI